MKGCKGFYVGLAVLAWLQTPALFAAPEAAGQSVAPAIEVPVQVTVKTLTAEPKAGTVLEVEVDVQARPQVQVQGPEYEQTLGDWVVLGVQQKPEASPAEGYRRTDRLRLLTYADGKVPFPALTVRYKTPAGQVGEYRSVVLPLELAPLPAKTAQALAPRDLKRPIGFFSWPLFLILALLAAAGIVAWQFWRRRSQAAGPVSRVPARPPEDVARERLAALQSSGWLAAGEFKRYYIELSEILRTYLQGRLGLPVLDRTTPELLRELKATSLSRQDLAAVRDVLEQADMAKFAKARPLESEALGDWQTVGGIVDRTAPVKVPEAPPAAPATDPAARSPLT